MESMERDIEELAHAEGVELVGFTDRERLADAPPSGDMTYVLPNAESGIGLAAAIDLEAAKKFVSKEDQWDLQLSHRESYRKLKGAGLAIQEYLEERGYDVALPMANFEYRKETENKWMTPPLSHKYLCTAAGVGWIGWSGNLLTREFGALVTIGSVVTNAKLKPSPMVEEDWCSGCKICVATCPTHYMPKQDADLVQIGDTEQSYSHRRLPLRCAVSCGGTNSVRKPSSKWSTWSFHEMKDMPAAEKSDEEFEDRYLELCREQPENRKLTTVGTFLGKNFDDPERRSYLKGTRSTSGQADNWDSYDLQVDQIKLSCSLCQMVCMPGLDTRKEMYRALVNSGRIEPGDFRLIDPTQPLPDWAKGLDLTTESPDS